MPSSSPSPPNDATTPPPVESAYPKYFTLAAALSDEFESVNINYFTSEYNNRVRESECWPLDQLGVLEQKWLDRREALEEGLKSTWLGGESTPYADPDESDGGEYQLDSEDASDDGESIDRSLDGEEAEPSSTRVLTRSEFAEEEDYEYMEASEEELTGLQVELEDLRTDNTVGYPRHTDPETNYDDDQSKFWQSITRDRDFEIGRAHV